MELTDFSQGIYILLFILITVGIISNIERLKSISWLGAVFNFYDRRSSIRKNIKIIEGVWIDTFKIDGKIFAGVMIIKHTKNGYYIQGQEFDEKLNMTGFWKSIISDKKRNELVYLFDTTQIKSNKTKYYIRGFTTLLFNESSLSERANSYNGNFINFYPKNSGGFSTNDGILEGIRITDAKELKLYDSGKKAELARIYINKKMNPNYGGLLITKETFKQDLLSYIWNYPLLNSNQQSWAVKESAVLRGDLENARKEPGLGVAILSTQFASENFGNLASTRVNKVINWCMSRTQSEPPHYFQVHQVDAITSQIYLEPDFRHTIAFAIILTRLKKNKLFVNSYISLVLDTQNVGDGGWPAGRGTTVSEIFTVMYAIEFLWLCSSDSFNPKEINLKINTALKNGIEWLIKNVNKDSLWYSGVLSEYLWDGISTTAWILHRLSAINININWESNMNNAVEAMLKKATNPKIWTRSSDLQRFRVEARVAASLIISKNNFNISDQLGKRVDIYLTEWKQRAINELTKLNETDMDLATALFLVDALVDNTELNQFKNSIQK